ncbi:MAG: pirin family protein [Actinomycetota bacterium]
MLQLRRDAEIFRIDGGWFQARWHFSFDQYHDPGNMGWGTLRVFNDDRLIPGAIWPLHPHRDIEGLTYVVEGAFRHEDDQGNDGVLAAGSVQRMTLGSGAWHSEQNASKVEPMRFLQMWIMPSVRGLAPSCEQRAYTRQDRADTLLEVFSPVDDGPGVPVHQQARVFVSALSAGATVARDVPAGFGHYLYLISGGVELDGEKLAAGDAAKIRDEARLSVRALEPSELITVEVQV